MPRGNDVSMTDDEVEAYLNEGGNYVITTIGHDGWPHAVAMFCAVDPGNVIRFGTYEKSQKIKNLARDDRVTVLLETGTRYEELKGVMIRGRATVEKDLERTIDTLIDALGNSGAGSDLPPGAKEDPAVRSVIELQARKRVLVTVLPEKITSWDHNKL
jgi:nitroimidazol reductase NimA-like FMN-containing flavoprotein (pyridoxamine 5'-phosphate oxidase superfamily)